MATSIGALTTQAKTNFDTATRERGDTMRTAKRSFLMAGDPAYEVLYKWLAVGICCQLDEAGLGVTVVNCTWPTPGKFDSPSPLVPNEALDELGQWHDEILSHLRYWKETREQWERIMTKHCR